ncbi:hypothetical protein CFP56_040487 [Quercus suber]|uniref:Uncharacterized protein n=1 Tax=Quercus suber TaxID=58331 RepID=A0AAW0IYG8_QUESU
MRLRALMGFKKSHEWEREDPCEGWDCECCAFDQQCLALINRYASIYVCEIKFVQANIIE